MADGFDLDFDIEGFREWTELAVKEVERDTARKVLRALALDFIRRVIEKTPVDFGRARAGWASFAVKMGRSPRIGEGKDPSGLTPGVAQTGKGVGKETTAEQAKGLAEGSFKESFRGADQFIDIINGVSYIVFLEFGSSDQAPGGMMRITFKEMQMGGRPGKEMKAQLVKTFAQVNRRLRSQRIGKKGRGIGSI